LVNDQVVMANVLPNHDLFKGKKVKLRD